LFFFAGNTESGYTIVRGGLNIYMRKAMRGFENIYEIDTEGNVYSLKFNKVRKLKPGKTSAGYYTVDLRKDGKSKTHYIHRLVAEAFVENPDNKPQVDHYDGDRTNNKVENLRWVSHQQNQFNTKAKGFYFNKRAGKYQAYITVDRKRIHLGLHDTEEAARAAYLTAKAKYHII
jgi:hypothetical protein